MTNILSALYKTDVHRKMWDTNMNTLSVTILDITRTKWRTTSFWTKWMLRYVLLS